MSTATRGGHLKAAMSVTSREAGAQSQPILQLGAAIHAPQVWEHHWHTACVRRPMLLKLGEIKENCNQRKVTASQDFQHPLHYYLTFPLILNCASKVQNETFEFGFSSQ